MAALLPRRFARGAESAGCPRSHCRAALARQRRRRFALQPLEQREARISVDPKSLGALIGLDRLQRRRADHPVRLSGHETLRDQQPLKLGALLERKMRLVGRPGMHEMPPAPDPVGEMPDGERIGLRHVVAEDRAEIIEHQEGRSARPFRREQRRLVGRAADRLRRSPARCRSSATRQAT